LFMKFLILSLIYSINTFAFYGVDNRMEYFEIKEEKLKKVAKAMAFQTYRDDSTGWDFNRFWTLKSSPLSKFGVCASEAYSDQPSFSRATCASVLIASNLLLTAGNCLTEHYCNNGLFYWMFNYAKEENTLFSLKRPRKDFYECKRIVKRVYDPVNTLSYSIIELKKDVKGVEPIKISQSD